MMAETFSDTQFKSSREQYITTCPNPQLSAQTGSSYPPVMRQDTWGEAESPKYYNISSTLHPSNGLCRLLRSERGKKNEDKLLSSGYLDL